MTDPEAESEMVLRQATLIDMKSARDLAMRIGAKLKDRPAAEDSTEIIRKLRDA